MTIKSFSGVVPIIAASAWVDEQALVVGKVRLADNVSVWPMAVLRGDVQAISIGAGSNIQDGAIVHVTHDSDYTPGGLATTVGQFVTVGHGAILHACTVHDEALIGMNATVLDGAVVQSQVMVAAGSLVPPKKVLTSGWLYAGNPVKPLRELTASELGFFKYSAQQYIKLARQYRKNTNIIDG